MMAAHKHPTTVHALVYASNVSRCPSMGILPLALVVLALGSSLLTRAPRPRLELLFTGFAYQVAVPS